MPTYFIGILPKQHAKAKPRSSMYFPTVATAAAVMAPAVAAAVTAVAAVAAAGE